MKNKALITCVAVACLFIGLVAGYSICEQKYSQQFEQVNKDLKVWMSELKKSNVDNAIRTLEVAAKGTDTTFMAVSLLRAKQISIENENYGAERIRVIQEQLKLRYPMNDNQSEGVK